MSQTRTLIAVVLACLVVTSWHVQVAAWQQTNKSQPRIVKQVVQINVAVEQKEPPNLVVTATGEVPTGGFEKVRLVRVVNATPPEDGIQDYVLFAVPPPESAITVISQIKAADTWKGYAKEAPWLKGVRVYGVDGGIVEKLLDNPKP